MGLINFPKHDQLKPPFNSIPITNWRLVGDVGANRIEIVSRWFHRFIIHDITLEYFHKINMHSYIEERRFNYVNSAAACSICHGAGKVDWIQKVRARGTPVVNIVKNYWRNKKVTNRLLPIQGHGSILYTLYGSEPNLHEGQEICGRCKGTGIGLMSKSQLLFEREDV